mgnify:CR=1 FL=1
MKGNNSIQLCGAEMVTAVNLWLADKFKEPAPKCASITLDAERNGPTFKIVLEREDACDSLV